MKPILSLSAEIICLGTGIFIVMGSRTATPVCNQGELRVVMCDAAPGVSAMVVRAAA
jgi:hypothetical protein